MASRDNSLCIQELLRVLSRIQGVCTKMASCIALCVYLGFLVGCDTTRNGILGQGLHVSAKDEKPAQRSSKPATTVVGNYVIEQDGQIITAKDAATGQAVASNTDAAAVIQGRLDTLTRGGRVLIRPGTYTLSHGLKVRHSNVTIEGEGYFNTVLRLGDNVNDNVIEVVPPVPPANKTETQLEKPPSPPKLYYFACRNFRIDGNRKRNTKGSGIIGPMSRAAFSDLCLGNIAEDGLHYSGDGVGVKIDRLRHDQHHNTGSILAI